MSKGTIGTVVGGVIGFVVTGFNPYGAQVGAMIGGAIGSSFDTVPGRKVGETASPRAQEGEPIPLAFGSARVTGRLMDAGKPVIKKSKDSGKGGPKVENETAYLSYSILICESSELRGSSISGILMVYENNKIVYDKRPNPAISAAESGKFLTNKVFYFGGESQNADPTEQMIHGAGNVPAYRGIARMVVHDENLTDKGGSIPTYEFVTTQCAATGGGLLDTDARWLGIGQDVAGYRAVVRPLSYSGSWIGSDIYAVGTNSSSINSVFRYQTKLYAFSNNSSNNQYPTIRIADISDLNTWTAGPVVPAPIGVNFGKGAISGSRYFVHVFAGGSQCYYIDLPSGAVWTPISITGATYVNVFIIMIGNGTNMIGVSANAEIWGSTNNGTTFTKNGTYFEPTRFFTNRVGDVNGNRFMFGGNAQNSGVDVAYYTDDLGVNVTKSSFPSGVPGGSSISQIKHCGGNNWLIAFSQSVSPLHDGLYLSTNNGVTFYPVNLPQAMYFGTPEQQNIAFDDNSGRVVIIGRKVSDGAYKCYYTDNFTVWTEISLAGTSSTGIAELYPLGSAPVYVGTPIPDSPGYYIDPITGITDGPALASHVSCVTTLQSIIDTLDTRAGIPVAKRDSADLAGITVPGYAVDTFMTVAEAKEPLRRVWFFDVPEYDDAIRYRRRGKTTDFTVNPDDVIPGEEGFEKGQRGQTVEYPKRLHVQYVDPVTGYKPMKQTAERISPDIRVKGEVVAGANITLDANTAKRAADIGLISAWAEREDSREIILPIDYWSKAIAAHSYSLNGRRYRITDMRLEAGAITLTSVYDRASAYTSTLAGVIGPTPTTPTPTIIGPTKSVLMNLPALRIADDGPGLYWAASGYPSTAWYGAALQFQRGLLWETQATAVAPAIIGTLAAALPVAASDLTDTTNVLRVVVNGTLNTVTATEVYDGANVAAILYADGTAEIVQFQTATETAPGAYDLTTLQRGRLDTVVAVHAIGASFVMLDAAVRFVPATVADIGATITYRAVGFDTDPDAATTAPITLTTLKSVKEWSITNLAATRDGGNNVTITWDGRPRLGTNVQPRQSTHFTGYRVEYASGGTTITKDVARTALVIVGGIVETDEVTTHSYTAAQQTIDFGSLPGSLTVTVSAVNDQQGAGASTGITI